MQLELAEYSRNSSKCTPSSHFPDQTISINISGNQTLADEDARSLPRGVPVFDKWPTDSNDESLRRRFGVLAQVLTVYGLQDDAVAAWQALKPSVSTNTELEDKTDATGTAPLVANDEVDPKPFGNRCKFSNAAGAAGATAHIAT
ncbi:hypothetical protein IAQ61_003267 [Plenodomus lingam]|uniref:uncharacterized protein n=1 Tax=Leptosphaeria maculans TaxID=5022 RepID=UPI0033300192|nr:hypothetical protein IAQ61_003267 [Plenodomus lingam]